MPENEQDTSFDWNVWKASREANTWQSPELYFPNHLEGNQFYPWLTESKNLYCSITPAGSQNSDIYLVEWKDGQYTSPKRLPETINTEALEGDAFVAPDESYLIFAGFERAQNAGKSDLYISFKKENGGWTEAQWLGEDINSEGYDGSPCVTIDGKYLIFTSSRGSIEENTFFNHYIVRFQLERYQRQAFS
jgi:Tol biopolymer transport system component